MAIEDKLNTTQRIRLEALAQSIMASAHEPRMQSSVILSRAREYERWIAKGKLPGEPDDAAKQ